MILRNKNSGRKKKIVSVEEDDPSTVQIIKKKVGRPKKDKNSEKRIDEVEVSQSPNESEESHIEVTSPTNRSIHHALNLSKRNSLINRFYDEFLGAPLEIFASSKLPLQRTVLQRYRALRAKSHNSMQNVITEMITNELMQLWEHSSIPHKNHQGCWDAVKTLINTWVDAKEEERKRSLFQDHLNTLFDLRPVALRSLSALKEELKSSGNINWKIDYDFFKGQLTFPQTTSMSSTKDEVLHSKMKEKASKTAKTQLYAEKNVGDFASSSTISSREKVPSSADITEQNIILKSPRQSASAAESKNAKILEEPCNDEETTTDNEDKEWELPYREQRRLRKRPETITLSLPARQLPSVLASTSTVTKTSARQELKLVSTLLKAGGSDINSATLSVSSIRRQRRTVVSSRANDMRTKIKGFAGCQIENGFVVLHWDGKIIQYISGGTEDRLAIAMSVPNHIPGQFLASPAIPDGTGKSMANCVHKTVGDLGLLSKVEALVFDTTASNTGKWSGSITLFEKMLGRALFWLACRHHVPELFIKHASSVVRGPSKGPDDPLFKKFKDRFNFINVEERENWNWPVEDDWRRQRAPEVLEWADTHMQLETWPREDYRELVELTVMFLGGVVKRMQRGTLNIIVSPIRKPGACHRARFMASCLYILKIFLFQNQFEATPEEISEVKILAEYIALLHVPYFLKSPLAISAPRQDRDFWIDLHDYKACFDDGSIQFQMVTNVQKFVCKHLWYLTQELVVFGLFDKHLLNHERKAMAEQLLLFPRPVTFAPGKPEFQIDLMTNNPSLEAFIGPRSWLLFDKLHADGQWLEAEPEEWDEVAEYKRMKECINDLKVVNDLAERCVKDIQEYANLTKDSEHRDDILLVVTDHRGIFQDLRKQALR